MKDQKTLPEYSSPQVKLMFIKVECSIAASAQTQNATIEDYESEDLFN